MKPFLSLCMIVRNEADLLERCLQSAVSIVDEIIIVDTGSTDTSKNIAAQYTANIYDLEWTQDFAAARNASIAKASGDWILVLDADEYLDSADGSSIKSFLHNYNSKEPLGVIVPIYNFVGSANSGKISQSKAIRLFTRNPDLTFVRPIHEQLQSVTGSLIELEYDFPIYHTGYTKETIEYKQKTKRNKAIFKQMSERGQLTPYDSFSLGNEYYAQDLYEAALSCYSEADQPSEHNKTWLPLCIGSRVSCLMNLHRYTEAYQQIQLAISKWSYVCDFYWLEGFLLAQIGMDTEAIRSLETCIQMADKRSEHPTFLISPNYGSTLPLQQLSVLHLRRFDTQQAVSCLTKLCYTNPNHQNVLLQLLKLVSKSEEPNRVEAFINSLYPDPEPYQQQMILEVCIKIGNKPLSELYKNRYFRAQDDLPLNIKLEYSLLHEDWQPFVQSIQQLPAVSGSERDSLLYYAAILWPQHESELMARISADFALNPAFIASICLRLFREGHYELYDQLIQVHAENSEALTNLLGNAFYEDLQYELALDYYSLMLQQDALSGQAYENLARLYFMQGEVMEGVEFARKALEHSPERIDLYLLLLRHVIDPQITQRVKSKLLRTYPGLRHFPLPPL
jgi:glycosyltransferase involved in cell wall biosynthesis